MKAFKSIKDKYPAKCEFSVTVTFFILKIILKNLVDVLNVFHQFLPPVFLTTNKKLN